METETKNPLVCLSGGSGEIEEKKSKFIANISPCENEEDAVNFISEMKKKYWDAKHNCSAFVLGDKSQITRCSDDGEPSKTAGRPMLDVLMKKNITGICVVVTRYFGGTLLGTGGLVRAYTQAVLAGLLNCRFGRKIDGCEFEVKVQYPDVDKVLQVFGKNDVTPVKTDYSDDVTFVLCVSNDIAEKVICDLTHVTSGKAVFGEKQFKSFIDKEEIAF